MGNSSPSHARHEPEPAGIHDTEPAGRAPQRQDTVKPATAKPARSGRTPVVMVVGKSGMGKSTLCNLLLYGNNDHGEARGVFKTAGGHEAVTTKCAERTVQSTPPPTSMKGASAGGPLRVIDTPGLPDTNKRTLAFYDKIVKTARSTGGLNAIIITVVYGHDRVNTLQDFETYAILLSQFDKMPCLKIMLCRFDPSPFARSDEQIAKSLEPVKAWVEEIMRKGGMESAKVIFLMNRVPDMLDQIFVLRQLVAEQPSMPVELHNIRTYDEMKNSARRLVDPHSRRDELEGICRSLKSQKVQYISLNESLEAYAGYARGVGMSLGALTALGGMGLAIATGLSPVCVFGLKAGKAVGAASADIVRNSFKERISHNKLRMANIDRQVAEIQKETLFGVAATREVLQADKDTLERLEKLE